MRCVCRLCWRRARSMTCSSSSSRSSRSVTRLRICNFIDIEMHSFVCVFALLLPTLLLQPIRLLFWLWLYKGFMGRSGCSALRELVLGCLTQPAGILAGVVWHCGHFQLFLGDGHLGKFSGFWSVYGKVRKECSLCLLCKSVTCTSIKKFIRQDCSQHKLSVISQTWSLKINLSL